MSKLGDDILALRAAGLSYRAIQSELGCSLSTVSYHLGSGQKQKTRSRFLEHKNANYLQHRLYKFQRQPRVQRGRAGTYSVEERFRFKLLDFSRKRTKESAKVVSKDFDFDAARAKIMSDSTCYLTGRAIDLNQPESYHLDHIVPTSKGGTNTVENMGLASTAANKAKHDLPLDEFLDLCYDVLKHHGRI